MTTKPSTKPTMNSPIHTPVDLRAEFPRSEQDQSIIYCNSASTGPLPARTITVLDEWNRLRAEPWRITFEQQFEASATARALCARLISADAEEIALVPNTSSGINIAAQILPIARGKVVLGHDGEFPANVYPWMGLEQLGGARLEQIALLPSGLPNWEALTDRLDRGDVGLVAISWVSFVSGDRADLMRIGALCRERGIWFVVDGIQGVGTTILDVRACNIDVLACGAQKWLLSPWGAGFCYVRRELVAELAPRSVGWLGLQHSHDFTRMLDYDLTYLEDARKFEFAA
ncbi:MAG: aminotransferase class V-fold PLP-dependent enzyme, partial [Gemmatimonadaceae bacterium]